MPESSGPWVVYQMALRGKPFSVNAVCEQSEWEAMEKDRPGFHTLVRDNIRDENVAEKLARGTSGDPVKRRTASMSSVSARPIHPYSLEAGTHPS